jgi:uncharacterized protein YukE
MKHLLHDSESHEESSAQHEASADELDQAHSAIEGRTADAASAFEGSDITQYAGTILVPAMGTIKDGISALRDRIRKAAAEIKNNDERHKQNEQDIADALDKINPIAKYDAKNGTGDKTPIVMIPAGNVPQDPMRRLPKRRKTANPPRATEPIPSTKIAPGSSELARAVDRARLADGARGESTDVNYAAFRCVGKDGKDVIVVGRSDRSQALHSEQVAGVPILTVGGLRVKEIYTERPPCNPTPRNCAIWLPSYFTSAQHPGLTVTHGFDVYGGNGAQESEKLTAHINDLFAHYGPKA